jgi:hypothetical protein
MKKKENRGGPRVAGPGKKMGAPAKALKKPYQVQLPPATIEKIKTHCSLTKKTQSDVVESAIFYYLTHEDQTKNLNQGYLK